MARGGTDVAARITLNRQMLQVQTQAMGFQPQLRSHRKELAPDMSVRTLVFLAICCLPLAAQSSRPIPESTARPLFAAIPASVITHADSFVLAQDGLARLYNFATGVNGTPFLQDVYKSFGLSPDGRHFLYLKARGKFPTFQL